jgi:hypothetical protein
MVDGELRLRFGLLIESRIESCFYGVTYFHNCCLGLEKDYISGNQNEYWYDEVVYILYINV